MSGGDLFGHVPQAPKRRERSRVEWRNWPFGDLQPHGYGLIYADPPWSFLNRSDAGEEKNPIAHYDCLELDDIQRLPVAELAGANCALAMWGTWPLLPEALDTVRRWGFDYKSGGHWHKLSKTGEKVAFGTGYIFRSASEFLLLGTRGHPEIKSHSVRNAFGDELIGAIEIAIAAPVREHSRKPDMVRAALTELFNGPYAELFAREAADGWESWGNQVGKFGDGQD